MEHKNKKLGDSEKEERMKKLLMALIMLFVMTVPSTSPAITYTLNEPYGPSDARYSMGGEYWLLNGFLNNGIIGLGTTSRGEWTFSIESETPNTPVYLDLSIDINTSWMINGKSLDNFIPPTSIYSSVTFYADIRTFDALGVTNDWLFDISEWSDTSYSETQNLSLLLLTGTEYLLNTRGDYNHLEADGFSVIDPEIDTSAELWTNSDIRISSFNIRSVPEPLFLLAPAVAILFALRRRHVLAQME
jgi:hypothetical protein